MDQTSTMHSVDTGFIYAVFKLLSSNNTKYSGLILYDRGAKKRSCTSSLAQSPG